MTIATIRAGNGSPPGPARYDVRHTTTYAYSEAVPVCHNEIHLVPRELPTQRLLSSFIAVEPPPAHVATQVDYFGNATGVFSIDEPHERLVVTSTSRVEVDPPREWTACRPIPWEHLRDRLRHDTAPATLEARQFTDDSPLVRASAELAAWAGESFTPPRSTYSNVSRRPDVSQYRSAAAITSARPIALLTGTSRVRSSSSAACRLTAR